SIRAFEVAARYLSFTAAAEELNVTQSAVSRHIRHLEEHLGTKLFDRHHRSLTLTDAGEVYRAELTDLFRRLAAATGRVVRTNKSRLHIHSYSTFAMHWLIPRLPDFKEAHPEIDLQLTAFSKPLAAQHELIHAIIRVGAGDFDKTDRLFSVDLLPVCAPALRERAFRSGSIEALSNATLLHSIAANANWPIWAQSVGLSDLDTSKGMRFESSAMAYAAAERGLGVALAQAVL